MPNTVDVVVVVAGGADGAQSIVDSPTPSNIVWNGVQFAINTAQIYAKSPAQLAGMTQLGAGLTLVKVQVDMIDGKSPALGDVISLVGAGVTMTAAVAAAGAVTAAGAGAAAAAVPVGLITAASIVVALSALYANKQGYTVADLFNAAQEFVQTFGDPLTLDLNGDGIHTVPLKTPPLLFDINANGVKISTGWIAPDDGLLVLDRNGNGIVDNGSELFGDATPAYGNTPTGRTADGFAALAQEDTNADGVVNSADANFANLRVWQDLNQDGLSQPDELTTLESQGIASFNTARTAHSQMLPSGNQMADLGSFTRTDGSTGSTGSPQGMADVNLAVDTFHRTFADTIPLTAEAEALPDMQGCGVVRDLRQAASIQTAEGATLATALGQFSAATTRNDQRALLDTLIADWGATSGFEDMQTKAAAHGYTLSTNLDAVHQARLNALEQFNGRSFYRMPWETTNAQGGVTGMSVIHDATGDHIVINMNSTQLALLDQAYSALRESVYDALVVQPRLKPYLDDIRGMEAANDAMSEVAA